MHQNFLTLDQQDPIQYRETVYKNARPDIENLVNRFGLKGKTILSVASGYGAEEDLFAEMGCKVICVEGDPIAANVHLKFKSPEVRLLQMTSEEYLNSLSLSLSIKTLMSFIHPATPLGRGHYRFTVFPIIT